MAASHLGVTVREAGWLLGRPEPQVRGFLRSGALTYAVTPTRIDPATVRALIPDDALRPLREAALLAILDDRVQVPAPATRYAMPVPITDLPMMLKPGPAKPQ